MRPTSEPQNGSPRLARRDCPMDGRQRPRRARAHYRVARVALAAAVPSGPSDLPQGSSALAPGHGARRPPGARPMQRWAAGEVSSRRLPLWWRAAVSTCASPARSVREPSRGRCGAHPAGKRAFLGDPSDAPSPGLFSGGSLRDSGPQATAERRPKCRPSACQACGLREHHRPLGPTGRAFAPTPIVAPAT
jgi:hypothetical protein